MTTLEQAHQLPLPAEVRQLLDRHMLVDGLEIVVDLAKSHGPYLHDALQGRDLLDFFGNFSTTPLGYNHPYLRRPEVEESLLQAAVNKLANSDLYTPEMAAFVDAFASTLPESLSSHLFFIAGGALAVENALKAAFDWKTRKNMQAGRGGLGSKIIHFRHAFHGRSGYTLSLTNTDPKKTDFFPKFEAWPRISTPRLSFPVTQEILRRVEVEEERAVREIEAAVDRYPHDIAGLIIEPIQGEGGDNHFRAEFLQRLRQLADDHEFLLLFDEVQTGFGTTGRWWCFEHFDIEPDVLAFGKKSQVCGIAASRRLDEVDSVFHVSSRINSTWGGNLVDMVRCRAVVEAVEEEALLERVTSVGELLLAGLQRVADQFPGQVTNARGRGLFVAFDLPDSDTRGKALEAMAVAGLLGLASGQRSIRFRPPLILSEEQATEGLGRVETALRSVLG